MDVSELEYYYIVSESKFMFRYNVTIECQLLEIGLIIFHKNGFIHNRQVEITNMDIGITSN